MDIDMISSSDELAELQGNEYIEKLEAIYNKHMQDFNKDNLQILSVTETEGRYGKQYEIIFEGGMTGFMPSNRDTAYIVNYFKNNGCKKEWIYEVKSENGLGYYKFNKGAIYQQLLGIYL